MAAGIVFTLVTLIGSSLTVPFTFILCLLLILHVRRDKNVAILLIINTYASMFVFSLMTLLTSIKVLKSDLNGVSNLTVSEMDRCRFEGLLNYETFGCCYMSFVLQALYRLTRVIYAKYKYLKTFIFNLLCIILQWIVYFLLILPAYFWPGPLISFYDTAYYCGIQYEKILGLTYTVSHIYVLPIAYLVIIYTRLMNFVRHQTPQLSQTQQGRRAQRDFVITRRILFIVISLTIPGLPNVAFVVIANYNTNYSGWYFMYRIQWMGPAVMTFILSIATIYINSKIKDIIYKLVLGRNAIEPATIRMHTQQHSQTNSLVVTQA